MSRYSFPGIAASAADALLPRRRALDCSTAADDMVIMLMSGLPVAGVAINLIVDALRPPPSPLGVVVLLAASVLLLVVAMAFLVALDNLFGQQKVWLHREPVLHPRMGDDGPCRQPAPAVELLPSEFRKPIIQTLSAMPPHPGAMPTPAE